MVWSDHTIQKLSREFVTVADEVYTLYPEDPGNLARVQADPAHQFFKRYGESMPAGDWHHPGTKQGIYMIGPEGEYLEGKFAASGELKDLEARLRRALERWQVLKKQQHYTNTPVPAIGVQVPNGFAKHPMVLRVSLRDLAPGLLAGTDRWRRGRYDDANWLTFKQWAWNQNWFGVADPATFATDSKEPQPVAKEVVEKLCREVLVDNVRGQAPAWQPQHVKQAELTMRRLAAAKTWTIEYRGEARMDAGPQGMTLRLYGQAEWDPEQSAFLRFDMVALGERRGAWAANQRSDEAGPTLVGIAFRLFQAAPATPAKPGKPAK